MNDEKEQYMPPSEQSEMLARIIKTRPGIFVSDDDFADLKEIERLTAEVEQLKYDIDNEIWVSGYKEREVALETKVRKLDLINGRLRWSNRLHMQQITRLENENKRLREYLKILSDKDGYKVINTKDLTYSIDPDIEVMFYRLNVHDEEPLVYPWDIAKEGLADSPTA